MHIITTGDLATIHAEDHPSHNITPADFAGLARIASCDLAVNAAALGVRS